MVGEAMSKAKNKTIDFSLGYYSSDRKVGSVAVVSAKGGKTSVMTLETAPASDLDKSLKPVFVGLAEDHRVITLDPRTKELGVQKAFPVDAFPAHIYTDPTSNRDWFMNDGDKETGNDTLNCGDKGSSVTVIEGTAGAQAKFLKTICVGRGHHQAAFSFPSDTAPNVPRQAYISNLKDGSITVIGNDPAQADKFLQVLATINLCEPDKEEGVSTPMIPNNSFPHGLVYSKVTGKVYNLSNGYGTVAVINPVTHEIEQRIGLKGFSNLLVSPCGRYVLARGADRKSDPNHVMARLVVLDVMTNEVVTRIELKDIYISKYFFNPEGTKLYLTTSVSGSHEQLANLKQDALLVFDLTQLPMLKLTGELRLGSSCGTLDFLARDGRTELVFSSNSTEGAVAVICAESDQILEKIPVGPGREHSRLWVL
jgi:hypothetical protein